MIINKRVLMKRRNTRQRQLILDTLVDNPTHPTIQELYQNVMRKDNTIGQATVYRNINQLVEEGKVQKLSIAGNVDRYDGNSSCHYHLFCEKCGKVFDFYDDSYLDFLANVEKRNGVQIKDTTLILKGICKDCS